MIDALANRSQVHFVKFFIRERVLDLPHVKAHCVVRRMIRSAILLVSDYC